MLRLPKQDVELLFLHHFLQACEIKCTSKKRKKKTNSYFDSCLVQTGSK